MSNIILIVIGAIVLIGMVLRWMLKHVCLQCGSRTEERTHGYEEKSYEYCPKCGWTSHDNLYY